MTATDHQEKTYDWSEFKKRLEARGESIYAWAKRHDFNRKTVYAVWHGRITWGVGPKVAAIIDQALEEGLIDVLEGEGDDASHGATVTERRGEEN